jgi:hypothetical protein
MEVVRAEAEEVDEKAEVRCGEWSGPIRIGGGGEEKLAHVVSHRHSKHAQAGAAASSSRPSMSHCLSSAAPPHRSSSIGATSYPPPVASGPNLSLAGRFSAGHFVDSPQGWTASRPPTTTSTTSGRHTPSPTHPPSTRSPSTRRCVMTFASTCSASSRGDLRT